MILTTSQSINNSNAKQYNQLWLFLFWEVVQHRLTAGLPMFWEHIPVPFSRVQQSN